MPRTDRHEALRYIPSAQKAQEVILWLATREPGIDVYHLVKAAFFADKEHVARWGRPILGDDYHAAPFGPLPQVIYGLLRDDPIEVLALGANGPPPFRMDAGKAIFPDRDPNLDRLSDSDVAALETGYASVVGKSFDDLVRESHAEPSYRRAIAGTMDYREFLPQDAEDRAAKVEHLEEAAPYAVF